MDNDAANPDIKLNGKNIEAVNSIVHLGHILHDNIFKNDSSKCISDFNIQCNSFLADFKNSGSYMRNYLFFKYCTSFYGSQFLPIYNDTMDDVYKAWRMSVRRVWRVPWRTHCEILPHLAGVMPPELSFAKNAISFTKLLLKSENPVVKMVTGMGMFGYHSVLGHNTRYLNAKYNLKTNVVNEHWKTLSLEQEEIARIASQIRELCYLRDTRQFHILSRTQINDIINHLCTE